MRVGLDVGVVVIVEKSVTSDGIVEDKHEYGQQQAKHSGSTCGRLK
jgi:hypothetical protein